MVRAPTTISVPPLIGGSQHGNGVRRYKTKRTKRTKRAKKGKTGRSRKRKTNVKKLIQKILRG